MKKSIRFLILLIMTLIIMPMTYAVEQTTVIINGTKLVMEEQPVLINGRTLVPLRAIFEAMNVIPKWDSVTKTVSAKTDSVDMKLTIGSQKAIVNGKNIKLDAPGTLVNGRTMVPARFIAETLGADVKWDAYTRTVMISTSADNIEVPKSQPNQNDTANYIVEEGKYTSKDEVAAYIKKYNRLPKNYITKKEAISKGWDSSKGNLWDVTDKMSIGGDYFGNREGVLLKADGRKYYECDIDYAGSYRNAKRIVYSNDGLIYYTDDHYDSFTLLFGEK